MDGSIACNPAREAAEYVPPTREEKRNSISHHNCFLFPEPESPNNNNACQAVNERGRESKLWKLTV